MSAKWLSSLRVVSLSVLGLAGLCAAQSGPQSGLQASKSNQPQAFAALPSCVQNADFCVTPSVQSQESQSSSCTSAQSLSQTQFFAFCFDPSTGQPIPGVTIQITVQAEDGTGGHLHTDANRPHGNFNPSSGLVDATTNLLQTMYTSPDTSGIVDATVSGTLSDGVTPCTPATFPIGVETQGLVAIPLTGSGYATTPSTGHDSNNVYANPSVSVNLQRLPVNFDILAQALINAGFIPNQTIPTLTYTSLSLLYGGLFDVDALGTGSITNPWHPPHCGHRQGTNADLRINNIPAQFRPALIQSILDSHFTMPVRTENPSFANATHWHLKAN
jgi:hypothetical protein